MVFANAQLLAPAAPRRHRRFDALLSGLGGVERRLHEARYRSSVLRTGRPRIGYIGWIGHGNLGDDAMLEAVRGMLNDAEVIQYAYDRTERRLARLGLSGSRFFDSVVLGGGTLISDGFEGMPRLALEHAIPIWSFGTGVGSSGFGMPAQVTLDRWRDLLPRFQCIGVRGPLSRARLCELGVDAVEVVGDPALSLARSAVRAADPPRFALNLTLPTGSRYDAAAFPFLYEAEVLVRRLVRAGWDPVPIALNGEDVPALAGLLARLGRAEMPLPVMTAASDVLDEVAPCKFAITVRLHAAILSCCVGVPPLMLGYRDKCLDFMQSMDLQEHYVGLDTMADGELVFRAERLIEAADGLRSAVEARAQAWKQVQADYLQRVMGSA